jgi:hypothetical protein
VHRANAYNIRTITNNSCGISQKRGFSVAIRNFCRLGVAMLLAMLPGMLKSQEPSPAQSTNIPAGNTEGTNLYLKIGLDDKVKLAGLKPGEILEGKLTRDVYSQYQQLFPKGSVVRLTVDSLEKSRREPNDHWPWVVNVFTPRHEKYPTFQSAKVVLENGRDVPLKVSFVSIGRDIDVRAEAKRHNSSQLTSGSATGDKDLVSLVSMGLKAMSGAGSTRPSGLEAKLEASLESTESIGRTADDGISGWHKEAATIVAGTQAKVILLAGLRASRSKVGDRFQAQLIEPVKNGSAGVLPEGTILEGKVIKRVPPRMLSRSGSLVLSFTTIETVQGSSEPIEATIAGVEVNDRSRMQLDQEGSLQGDRPGLAWTMLNLAATGGIAKMTDDGLQLVIEMIVSSATDVSTAGTARIVAACASTAFLLTRHGRDVVLPRYTEMEIAFGRAVRAVEGTNSTENERRLESLR